MARNRRVRDTVFYLDLDGDVAFEITVQHGSEVVAEQMLHEENFGKASRARLAEELKYQLEERLYRNLSVRECYQILWA